MKSSKIIVLIADSMAIKEGADKMKVKQMTSIYQQCLEPLLTLLNIKECTQIILSSQLEEDSHYQETLKEVSKTKALQEHTEDREHYDYICTQSVITHAMSLYQDVGIKVGWINKVSAKELKHPRLDRLIGWDELKFDTICKASGCAMQYLYAKAGLKMIVTSSKNIGIKEGCPYTAYADHHRYVMKHEASKSVVIAKPLSAIARHWIPVVQACLKLKTIDALNTAILPKAMHATNNIVAVQQCLSYWTNLPVPSKNEEKESQGTK
jgi:hypothetical protein